jgi:hypothetical protein
VDDPAQAQPAIRLSPPRAHLFLDRHDGVPRPPAPDGRSTVEYSYAPGETRHESYGPGEYKVHDLENIGDGDMVFMTVEFLDSAAGAPGRGQARRCVRDRRVTNPSPW